MTTFANLDGVYANFQEFFQAVDFENYLVSFYFEKTTLFKKVIGYSRIDRQIFLHVISIEPALIPGKEFFERYLTSTIAKGGLQLIPLSVVLQNGFSLVPIDSLF